VVAARAIFHERSAPSTVEFDVPSEMSAVLEAWTFGGVKMFRATMTGNRLVRSHRDVRRGPAGFVGIAVQEGGTGRFEQFGRQQLVRPGELMVVDLDSPYDFGWPGIGGSRCINVPFDALNLSHNSVGEAAHRLQSSPLYDIMKSHINQLRINRDNEISNTAADALGSSTITLARAFLSSAHSPHIDATTSETVLIPQIRAYVRDRLSDRDLDLDMIARRYGHSPHRLQKWTAERGFDIDRWILAERLRGVRSELLGSTIPPGESVAKRWGFDNFDHLHGAFFDTYGMTVHQWWELRDER
jgi:AraC-like DNA-binding protein